MDKLDVVGVDAMLEATLETSVLVERIQVGHVSLLRRLANLPATIITDPIANYTEFKGAMAENAVLQSMLPRLDNQMPCYWTSGASAEVEFVIQWGENIIPVEVKAEENINGKSLSVYTKKYDPKYRMRFSMLNLLYNCGLLSSPAPLASWFDTLISIVERNAQ